MPNIFSRPNRCHFPNVRDFCQVLIGLQLQICDDIIDRTLVIPGDISHSLLYFYYMVYIKQFMLRMLRDIPLNELMGVIVNSGLLHTAKRMGRFLGAHPNISRFDDQAIKPLKFMLMPLNGNPNKSLFIGFLALQILYSRHLEEGSVEHVFNMLNHTFFRADVVEVLRGWYRTSLAMTNTPFSNTDEMFNEMFGLFFNRIAWFDVMIQGILQAPPPPPPPPQLAPIEPQIEDIIV